MALFYCGQNVYFSRETWDWILTDKQSRESPGLSHDGVLLGANPQDARHHSVAVQYNDDRK